MEISGIKLFWLLLLLLSFSRAFPYHSQPNDHLDKRESLSSRSLNFSTTGLPILALGVKSNQRNTLNGANHSSSSLEASMNHYPPALNKSSAVKTGLGTSGSGLDYDNNSSGLSNSQSDGNSSQITSVKSLQMLQEILNSTLSSLPGLEELSSQIQKLLLGQLNEVLQEGNNFRDQPGSKTEIKHGMNVSVNATTTNTVSVQDEVEMNGTDSQGRACETYGYVTLSATTLTTLSGLFQSLDKLEKSVGSDGSQQSVRLIQKARAQVSLTMFSVVKLTATPAVTSCYASPSQITFSSHIQANVTMCAQMITQIEKSLKSGKTSAKKSTHLEVDQNVAANSTLNQTLGSSSGLASNLNSGNSSSGLTSSLGKNSSSQFGGPGLHGGLLSNTIAQEFSGDNSNSSEGTTTTLLGDTQSSLGSSRLKKNISDSSAGSLGVTDDSTQSVSLERFSQVKASFAAVAHVTTGLISSEPSQGIKGIHVGATSTTQINVNIKSRMAVHSKVIDRFIDQVNDGSAAQDHNAGSNPEIQDKDGMSILQAISGGFGISGSMGLAGMGESRTGGSGVGGGTMGSSSDEFDPSSSSSGDASLSDFGIGSHNGNSSTYPTSGSSLVGPGNTAGSSKGNLTDAEGDDGTSGLGDGGSGSRGLGGTSGTVDNERGAIDPSHGASSESTDGFRSGTSETDNCGCKLDPETHHRIRNLENQLNEVHGILHKRGLTEL